MKRPIQKDTSDILCIGKFWEASENKQIPYQSVRGPFSPEKQSQFYLLDHSNHNLSP